MTQYKIVVVNEGKNKQLSVTLDANPPKSLSVDTTIIPDLPDYSEKIQYYYTEDYWRIPSVNYKEGDRFLNEHVHFWTVVAHMVGQFPNVDEDSLVHEKAMFSITCPSFTGQESFYLESLSYYLLYHNVYNTQKITDLLELSVENLKVNNFFNSNGSHLFCFYNDTYTDYTFDLTDKFTKNAYLINAMTPLLWYNKFYKLRRSVLQVGGTPFLVNGEELVLDIVDQIEGV